jgi:hypothetical protein
LANEARDFKGALLRQLKVMPVWVKTKEIRKACFTLGANVAKLNTMETVK